MRVIVITLPGDPPDIYENSAASVNEDGSVWVTDADGIITAEHDPGTWSLIVTDYAGGFTRAAIEQLAALDLT